VIVETPEVGVTVSTIEARSTLVMLITAWAGVVKKPATTNANVPIDDGSLKKAFGPMLMPIFQQKDRDPATSKT
jgi:hypothetical protein